MTFEYCFPVIFMGNLKEIIEGKFLCLILRAMSLTKSFSSSVTRITRERQREEEDAERGEPPDISARMTEQNSNSCPTSPIIWWWHRMGTARTWAKELLSGVRFWGDEREQSIYLSSNISATEGPACTRALQEGWKALINKHMGGGEQGLCKLKWSQQGRSTESSFFTNANHLGIGQRTVRWSKLWEGHVQICKRRCVSSAHL